jgi:Zn-dependent alcohol dehydrogenase
LVSRTYTLEEINAAIESVKRGEARRNVVVFGNGS